MHRLRTLTLALFAGAVFLALAGPAMASGGGRGDGAVYTLTNSASGNAVAVFERDRDGSLTARGTVATGGNGTGAGLGSQGALILDDDRLFAVNAGDNTISLLQVDRRGKVRLADVDPSGGARPISVTVHGKVRLRPERRECHDAGEHPRLPGAVGQARSAAGLDPAVERGRP